MVTFSGDLRFLKEEERIRVNNTHKQTVLHHCSGLHYNNSDELITTTTMLAAGCNREDLSQEITEPARCYPGEDPFLGSEVRAVLCFLLLTLLQLSFVGLKMTFCG